MPRMMEVVTALGTDVLLFHEMTGWEGMNRGFEYRLDLLSSKNDINPDEILGTNVTVKLILRHESVRFFNGFVTRFEHGGMLGRYYRYVAIVRPWLWFLTRTADCRIFQEMTVPDIIKQVFGDHGMADYKLELIATYKKWNYCVQYRETDFNFISRLMEEEGIGYYFRHTEGHNTLVLTDTAAKHKAVPDCEQLSFIAPSQQVRPDYEYVSQWDSTREVQPGAYVHDDYNFEVPGTELRTTKTLPRKYKPSTYEVFDYPGHYMVQGEGEQYASVRIDEIGTQFETAFGATNARGLTVGALLTLDNHPREDQNREYLIVGASYQMLFENYEALPDAKGASYNCTFTAIPSRQQYRPARVTPKPFVQGPQTAVVTGPAGEEIHTDQYGRIKVQFHWDRLGKKDENSSCWIRVSQMWAGKGWGSVSTPRIGHEVIVGFLEGDPDQPIILGAVHNAENMPPHTGVVSGLKSNTHKGTGFNQMTMDDTAGKEQITIHGQYDMTTTVKHDKTTTVNNNRTTTVVVDDTLTVNANRTLHVKGKFTETIDTGQETTIASGHKETITGGSNSTISGGLTSVVNGTWDNTVNGHVKETITSGEEQGITGAKKLTVSAGFSEEITGDRKTSVTGPLSQTATATMDLHAGGAGTYSSDASLKLSVAGSVVEISPSAITISAGGSTIKVDASGVALNGAKISLN